MSIGALLRPKRSRSSRVPSDLHGVEHQVFFALLKQNGLPLPTPELRFAKDAGRRWAFDYGWGDAMLALEVEGGAWTNGRHTRGKGFLADCEKYSEAAVRGWAVIRIPPKQLLTDSTLALIRRGLTRTQPEEK